MRKKASAIIVSDLHIQEDAPVCRLDNYREAMEKKLEFLTNLQRKHNCCILVPGDIFDHWKPSPELISWAMKHLPPAIICVPGQHDLPLHQMEYYPKSGLATLETAGIVHVVGMPGLNNEFDTGDIAIYGYPWGHPLSENTHTSSRRIKVALIHHMVWENEPWPGADPEGNVMAVMKKLKGYDLIVSGDNHQSFVWVNKTGQMIVNPGSLMRRTADQKDYLPKAFLYYASEKEVEELDIPIEDGEKVITREHIDIKAEKDARMEAFINRLGDEMEIGLSYELNVKKALDKGKVKQSVRDIVTECMEEQI